MAAILAAATRMSSATPRRRAALSSNVREFAILPRTIARDKVSAVAGSRSRSCCLERSVMFLELPHSRRPRYAP